MRRAVTSANSQAHRRHAQPPGNKKPPAARQRRKPRFADLGCLMFGTNKVEAKTCLWPCARGTALLTLLTIELLTSVVHEAPFPLRVFASKVEDGEQD